MNDQATETTQAIFSRLDPETTLQPITYEAPQWLIEPYGWPAWPADLKRQCADGATIRILPDPIVGWGGYNAIVRIEDEDGWACYLAVLKEEAR